MDNSPKTQTQRLNEAINSSRKTQAKRLSEAIDKFDTALEQDPQRLIQYQVQPALPHQNPPIFPGLPPSAQLLCVLIIFVHLKVLWEINRKK